MQFKIKSTAVQPIRITQGVFFVPCRLNSSTRKYEPCITPFKTDSSQLKTSSRQVWTLEEDENLKQIVEETGAKNWSSVASQINSKIYEGLPVRQGKQCRERWFGSLCPEIQKEPWTVEEDFILFNQQKKLGNKWSLMTESLPGRTENQIKNRWRKIEKNVKNQMKFIRKELKKQNVLDCLIKCVEMGKKEIFQ